mmetsp:Transcript_49619/g.141892  ORF Transcript_49619/g.141892 Transcript_49619/m.141892 type:complete len:342 (+) Transcript_49619:748-1773(+)
MHCGGTRWAPWHSGLHRLRDTRHSVHPAEQGGVQGRHQRLREVDAQHWPADLARGHLRAAGGPGLRPRWSCHGAHRRSAHGGPGVRRLPDVCIHNVPPLLGVRASAVQQLRGAGLPELPAAEDPRLRALRGPDERPALLSPVPPVAPLLHHRLPAELHPRGRGHRLGGAHGARDPLRREHDAGGAEAEHAHARDLRHPLQDHHRQPRRGPALREHGRQLHAHAPGRHGGPHDALRAAAGRHGHVPGDPHHGRDQVLHGLHGDARGLPEPAAHGPGGRQGRAAQELRGPRAAGLRRGGQGRRLGAGRREGARRALGRAARAAGRRRGRGAALEEAIGHAVPG